MTQELHTDLVGRPYLEGGGDPAEGLSCSGAVLELLRRLGFEVPPGALPLGHDRSSACLADAASEASPWVRVGSTLAAAKRPGDVVLMRLQNGRHHVAAALGDGTFLSADAKRGVHVMRLRRILGEVLGVYRLRRA